MKLIKFTPILLVLAFASCGKGSKNGRQENDTIAAIKVSPALPNYNIYIENSASMDGYVKGVTDFEQTVYNYISDINIKGFADSLNLFYINSKPIPYGSDIEDFISKLEPTTFKSRGGNRSTTDIANLIKTILQHTNDSNISILVSDFIFSPGKKNSEEYLVNQQIGIKTKIAQYLKDFPDHGVIIYHLESKFDGVYYDKFDHKHKYEGLRPYYIWVIGNKQHLSNLREKCPKEKFLGSGVKNEFIIAAGNTKIEYAVKRESGNFKVDKKNKQSLSKLRKEGKGRNKNIAKFSINVNMRDLLCDESYLTDTSNYTLSDKDYKLEIQKSKDPKWTHTLTLTTEIIKPSTLEITLKSQVPSWINEISDSVGVGIDDTNKHKTFGFEYLINGIYQGFTTNQENQYTKIKININN